LYLDYEAPPAVCPDRATFWNEFWARSSKEGEQPVATLRVRIVEQAEGFIGRISIDDSMGGVVDRVVSAPTCAEVTLALVVISSISLHDLPTAVPAASPIAPRATTAPPKPARNGVEWSLGATLGIHEAVAPSGALAMGIAAGVRSPRRWGSPEVRLELLAANSGKQAVSGAAGPYGTARFDWYGGRIAGCPLQLNVATTSFGPCAVVEVGRLTGTGVSSMGQVAGTGWWLAPGAQLNWTWRPLPLQVRLAAGAVRPVVRDSFDFSPELLVFRPPTLGLVAQLEAGVSF
jgi:hypothetical protein